MGTPALRQGQVYWLDDCPPLGPGDEWKTRPVVVLDDAVVLSRGEAEVLVVACSTTTRAPDRVEIPSKATSMAFTSGLADQTWAVPEWVLPAKRARLTRLAGYVSGSTLRRILEAVLARETGE